jgi:hypothetical protein
MEIEVSKWICVTCPKGWEKVMTPGKIYDFKIEILKYMSDDTETSETAVKYSHFIGDNGKDQFIPGYMKEYFLTLDEWRQNKLNEIGI